MKRMLAIFITAVLLCSATACTGAAGDPTESMVEPSGTTQEVALSHSYRLQKILAEENLGFTKFYQFGEKVLTYSPQQDRTAVIGIFDPETEDFIPKEIPETELLGVSVQEEQIAVMLQETSSKTYTTSLRLVTFDSTLQEIESIEVSSLWGNPEWCMSWTRDAQGNEYLSYLGEGILCRREDGSIQKIEKSQGRELLFTSRTGEAFAVLDHYTLQKLLPDSMSTQSVSVETQGSTKLSYLAGNERYDALCYDKQFLYGVDLTDGSMEELMNWTESDFTESTNRSGILLLPDGRVLLSASDLPEQPDSNYLLTARTQEELSSMKMISMATMSPGSGWLEQMVIRFNRQSNDCRIVMKSYYDENAEDEGISALKQDMLSGNMPDILTSYSDYHMFSDKGVFEDLGVWMENDPDFNEDTYLMNFFESLKYKGRLERIGFKCAVDAYAAKSEFLDGAQSLTLSDYMELELPDDMKLLSSADRQSAFDDLIRSQLGAFVDYENGTCSFDSEEFIALLEWFGSFPEKAEIADDYAYRENRALLYPTQVSSLLDYHATIQCWFDNAEVTLTGTPIGSEGNGGVFAPLGLITVSSASQYKSEIWEFLKFCLNEENQSMEDSYGFPLNLNALSAMLEKDQQERAKTDTVFYEFGGEAVEVMPATAEEAAEMMAYLKEITVCGIPDDFIENIVDEETGKFFAGDCTAADAARVIQSRVGLYLAE